MASLLIWMGSFCRRSSQSSCVLKDKDIVCVKRKKEPFRPKKKRERRSLYWRLWRKTVRRMFVLRLRFKRGLGFSLVEWLLMMRKVEDLKEELKEIVPDMNLANGSQKKNRIQVSNTKKPLFFYINLAKRYMQEHNDVELSALGMAIATVVTIAEILKNNGFSVEKKIMTSTVDIKEGSRGRLVQKPKIEITLGKSDKFDELIAAANEEKEAAEALVQS